MRTCYGLFACLSLIGALPAAGANFSFSGTFFQDDNAAIFRFEVPAPTSVTMRTWSFAGGVNAAGATISPGGFAPILALFEADSLQLLLAQDANGGPGACPPRATDLVSGFCWDAVISATLGQGNYLLVLTQDDNFPIGPALSDGFTRTGQGDFTGPTFGTGTGSFLLVNGTQRTANWALDIRDVPYAVELPEPGSIALVAAGLGLALLRRRAGHRSNA